MNYQRFYFKCFEKNFSFLLTILFLLTFFIGSAFELFAQPDYLMTITNGEKVDQDTYEFDVLLNSTGESFQLTSYQAALNINVNSVNDSSLSFSFIEGTSQLNILPSIGVGLNSSDGKVELTFASLPGDEAITNDIKKVGRFRLETTENFDVDPSVNWNFHGKINTIVTGKSFDDITNPSSHTSDIGGVNQINVINVTASGTSDETTPEKTIDGLGYYDSDPSSRWAAQPLPQWISYDLGGTQSISSVRISFANFLLDRIYDYSISVSIDNISWTQIVSNASSLPEEWTIADFSIVEARYVKIDLLSSTNNPNQWANIWETEIYGNNKSTSVEKENDQPSNFELLQNYPNPFNPSTKIAFSLKQSSNASLSVYNVLGEEVAVLVKDFLEAGKHEITFNGENLASGIYIYKLNIDEKFTELKKMMLIK